MNNSALIATLESDISKMLIQFTAEPNDDTTRWHVYSLIHHHLIDMKNKSTITDFVVICDETNNPPDVIDSGSLQADVAIKPTNQQQFIYIPVKIMPRGANGISFAVNDYNRAMKGI